MRYPNDLTIALEYNSIGYLAAEKNAATGYVYRTVTNQDDFGNISAATLTNGQLTGSYLHSLRTGQMLSNRVTKAASNIHYLDYEDYDSYGNIKKQNNLVTNINASESFAYDNLHRLTQSTVSAASVTLSIDYAYDAVGNLTKKSDYSANTLDAYQYMANSNKLSSVALKDGVNSDTFGYDDKGNLTHRNDALENVYNAFNKPTSINKNGTSISLYYGADLARYKQVRVVASKTITTHYIGKLYEVESDGTNTTANAYISDVAIISQRTGDNRIRFTHRDRLGSATTFTDHNGAVTAYRGYDPFGKPKGGDWSALGLPQLGANLLDSDVVTRRGFTDHEHLDEAELIHMNGRVYDYNLGRFMSVDPLLHSEAGSQGINPYSYIFNNPLAGVDPTGYNPEERASAFGLTVATALGAISPDDARTFENVAEGSPLSTGEHAGAADVGESIRVAVETGSLAAGVAAIEKAAANKGGKKGKRNKNKSNNNDNGSDSSVKSDGNTSDIGSPKEISKAKRRAAREAQRQAGIQTSKAGQNSQDKTQPNQPRHQVKEGKNGEPAGVVDGRGDSNNNKTDHTPYHVEAGQIKDSGDKTNKKGTPRVKNNKGQKQPKVKVKYDDDIKK